MTKVHQSNLSYQLMSRVSFRRLFGLALASALVLVFLVSTSSFAVSQYAPNVTASETTVVPVTGGTVSVTDPTTGINVSVSGLTGVTGNLNVTTQTLNSPSGGVLTVSSSSNVFYFDVNVALPAGTTTPAGANATITLSNPLITSGYTLEYWDGSAWVVATDVTITGTTITATIPVSALTGTNVAIVKASSIITTTSTSTGTSSTTSTASTSTSVSTSMSSTDTALLAAGVIIIIIVIAGGFMLMRGRSKSAPAATT
jgi:hypothetical protein